MIEKFSRPPPEKRFSSWRKLFWPMTPSSAAPVDAGHGHVGEHAHDDQHPQDEEDAAADVRGAKGIDQRFEHGLLGRPCVVALGRSGGGVLGLGRSTVVGFAAPFASTDSAVSGSLLTGPGLMPSSVATSGAGCGASSWTKPPAVSIFCRAEAVKASAATKTLTSMSPWPSTLTGRSSWLMSPAAASTSALTVSGSLPASVAEASGGRVLSDATDVDDLVLDAAAALEAAKLGDADVDRRLAALEPAGDAGTGASLLALGAAPCGLALAGGDAAADPDAALRGAGRGGEVVELHDAASSFLLAAALALACAATSSTSRR